MYVGLLATIKKAATDMNSPSAGNNWSPDLRLGAGLRRNAVTEELVETPSAPERRATNGARVLKVL